MTFHLEKLEKGGNHPFKLFQAPPPHTLPQADPRPGANKANSSALSFFPAKEAARNIPAKLPTIPGGTPDRMGQGKERAGSPCPSRTAAQAALRTAALLGENAHTATSGGSPAMLPWGPGGHPRLLNLPDTATESREGKAKRDRRGRDQKLRLELHPTAEGQLGTAQPRGP